MPRKTPSEMREECGIKQPAPLRISALVGRWDSGFDFVDSDPIQYDSADAKPLHVPNGTSSRTRKALKRASIAAAKRSGRTQPKRR